MKDKVIEMLGAGVLQVQVATALGVEESYISQLMAEDGVRDQVAQLRAIKATEYLQHDSAIEDVEAIALERVMKLIPMETNIIRALKVFQVANAAKKKSESSVTPQQPSSIVNITLPQQALVEFKMTVDKQVVEVQGRSMATMPSHVLQAKLRDKKAQELLADTTPAIQSDLAKRLAQF